MQPGNRIQQELSGRIGLTPSRGLWTRYNAMMNMRIDIATTKHDHGILGGPSLTILHGGSVCYTCSTFNSETMPLIQFADGIFDFVFINKDKAIDQSLANRKCYTIGF